MPSCELAAMSARWRTAFWSSRRVPSATARVSNGTRSADGIIGVVQPPATSLSKKHAIGTPKKSAQAVQVLDGRVGPRAGPQAL